MFYKLIILVIKLVMNSSKQSDFERMSSHDDLDRSPTPNINQPTDGSVAQQNTFMTGLREQ
jgi:hypothetical protein